MDNSTAFWNIIFPTISPFAIIIVFFLLWRIYKAAGTAKVETDNSPRSPY